MFDGLPHHIVVTTGAELGDRLIQTRSPRLTPGRPLVADADTTLLATLDAEIVDQDILYGGVSIPAQAIRYLNRRTPSTVLTHVWQRHHQLRPPIVEWLSELGHDPQVAIRVRAAQAAGLLSAVDFSHTFPALIEREALARPPRRKPSDPDHPDESDDVDEPDETWELRRGFAAMALDQAALDDTVQTVVDAILRRWRRSTDPALRWTAARTLGFDIGLRSVEKSLDELRVIGTPQELVEVAELSPHDRAQVWDLRWITELSVARLFASGARHEILVQLREWLNDRRQSVRQLAQQAVVVMAELKMSAVVGRTGPGADDEIAARSAGRDRWPIVLGLTAEDPSLAAPVADVLRLALRSPGGAVVLDVVSSWLDVGQSDAAALEAFIALLPLLVVTESDRHPLRYAVTSRRNRWADPLSPDVADRIDAALAAVPTRRA